MLKSSHLLLIVIFLLVACNDEKIIQPELESQNELLSRDQVNSIVLQKLRENDEFKWEIVNSNVLWSAAMLSDSILAVGFQPSGFTNIIERIHTIDLEDVEWMSAKKKIFQIVVDGERSARNDENISIDQLLPFGEPEVVPSLAIHVTNPNTIEILRSMPEVRYVEAMGYYTDNEINERSSSGCGVSPNYNVPSTDYVSVAPGAKVPWNFYNHSIPTAWNSSTGEGVTIAIIDSGTSFDQDNLGNNFNSGYSQGRSVTKISTLYTGYWWWKSLTSADDGCGHGTQMAGMATGPRSNDGNSVGVAYNSDLFGIHAVEDVIISTSNEKNGVKNALIKAGKNSGVRVISMSIGTIFWSGTVADGVYYAYNKGKMMMAAAGTSTSFTNWFGVIFPASMSQTVAITGVKEDLPLTECNTCHYGSAVDFASVMQRSFDDDRTTLTLAPCCDTPSNVGGSSAATSMTAGIAALVWGQDPSMTRSEVMDILKDASQFYPARDNDFGWGMIDAAAAVASVPN